MAEDQRGGVTVYDVMVTRVDQQAYKPLFAATAGEKKKHYSYNRHNSSCVADGERGSNVHIKMAPLAFEAPAGAAGREMTRLVAKVHSHHRAFVLPRDDRKETSIFQATWIHRISTAVQLGTANMVYNISRMSRTKGRLCKEQYSKSLNVEAADADGHETSESDSSAGNIDRM